MDSSWSPVLWHGPWVFFSRNGIVCEGNLVLGLTIYNNGWVQDFLNLVLVSCLRPSPLVFGRTPISLLLHRIKTIRQSLFESQSMINKRKCISRSCTSLFWRVFPCRQITGNKSLRFSTVSYSTYKQAPWRFPSHKLQREIYVIGLSPIEIWSSIISLWFFWEHIPTLVTTLMTSTWNVLCLKCISSMSHYRCGPNTTIEPHSMYIL